MQGSQAFKRAAQLLEQRNNHGKNAIIIATECGNIEIVDWIIETYGTKKINVFARDYQGNSVMHIAVKQENLELVRKFTLIKSDQCMVQNHEGKSSFFLAVEMENYEIITDIFAEFKLDAVT